MKALKCPGVHNTTYIQQQMVGWIRDGVYEAGKEIFPLLEEQQVLWVSAGRGQVVPTV